MQALSVGTHLSTPRRGYTHHGIYAGNGRVIHYAGFSRALRRGPVEEVSLERFTRGRGFKVVQAAAPTFAGAAAAEHARLRLGEDRYRLWSNNCEHFATWCLYGESRSRQVEQWRARLPAVLRAALERRVARRGTSPAPRRAAPRCKCNRPDVGGNADETAATETSTRCRAARRSSAIGLVQPQLNKSETTMHSPFLRALASVARIAEEIGCRRDSTATVGRAIAAAALVLLGATASAQPILAAAAGVSQQAAPLPQQLRDTGLYVAGSTTEIARGVVAFSPQYPLWSDGTTKRRWLYLPPGTSIDASDPDAWDFPIGTRLWKEFSVGRPVETRFIERLADGSWRFAAYVWNEQGTEAVLAPARGLVNVPVAGAPDGRYEIPSRNDCLACHEGAAVPVLGASALQLSPDRDPLAPHAGVARPENADLRALVERALLRNLPPALLTAPPRIDAPSPTARAALGYLHGNCGHCHNDRGPLAGLDLALAQQAGAAAKSAARTIDSLVGHVSRYRAHGADAATRRVVPGAKEASVLAERMISNNPLARMPPLGVRVVDAEGVALVERWIHHDLQPRKEPAR